MQRSPHRKQEIARAADRSWSLISFLPGSGDAIMVAVTIRNPQEEAPRVLTIRAAEHDRRADADMRAILDAAERPDLRLRPVTALSDICRKAGLTHADRAASGQRCSACVPCGVAARLEQLASRSSICGRRDIDPALTHCGTSWPDVTFKAGGERPGSRACDFRDAVAGIDNPARR